MIRSSEPVIIFVLTELRRASNFELGTAQGRPLGPLLFQQNLSKCYIASAEKSNPALVIINRGLLSE
jgi:hypothetical protein